MRGEGSVENPLMAEESEEGDLAEIRTDQSVDDIHSGLGSPFSLAGGPGLDV